MKKEEVHSTAGVHAEPLPEPAAEPSRSRTSSIPPQSGISTLRLSRPASDDDHRLDTIDSGAPRDQSDEMELDALQVSTQSREGNEQTVYSLRGHNHVLIVDNGRQECYFLKWKTFNKLQRKGKELDPRYFDKKE